MERHDFHLGLAQIASRPSSPAALVRSQGANALLERVERRNAKVPAQTRDWDPEYSPSSSESSKRSARAAALEHLRATIKLEGMSDKYIIQNLDNISKKYAEDRAGPPEIECPPPELKKGLLKRVTNKLKGREQSTKPPIDKASISLPLSTLDNNHEMQGHDLIDILTANRLRFLNSDIRVEDAAGLRPASRHPKSVRNYEISDSSDDVSSDAVASNPGCSTLPFCYLHPHAPPPEPTQPEFPARSKTVGHPDRDTTFSMFLNASPASSEENLPPKSKKPLSYRKPVYKPGVASNQMQNASAQTPSYAEDYPKPLRVGKAAHE